MAREARFATAALGVLLGIVAAPADMVAFDLTWEFSGATAPSGDPPWLRATFTSTTPGTVELRLDNLLNGPTEYIRLWYLNLDSGFDLDELAFVQAQGPTPQIDTGFDTFKANGHGFFDIRLKWPTAVPDPNRFDSDYGLAEFTITSTQAITASSFNVFSSGGAHWPDGLLTAAKVQGIGPTGDDSGWVTVPAPDGGILGVLGLATLGLLRRRFA